ncbi:MAG: class I SAM-dependent methyltransferase [Lachnospiraceae bacterium]|nr:class I SAM-dependent methyltransferase [Lachnospiraceae bacterium]
MGKFDNLVDYYNKFNEDKRLKARHGIVEYEVTMFFLMEYCRKQNRPLKILDLGAGTGAYSIALAREGHEVTAMEYVNHNLGRLKQHAKEEGVEVKAYQGDAREIALYPKRYPEKFYDVTLIFGPMYHLFQKEEKELVLREAMRVTKPSGRIYVAYVMNEYSILTYGFKEGHLLESMASGKIDKDFHVKNAPEDLYDYVRLADIDALNQAVGAKRVDIFSPDGPANLMRPVLKEMDEETFAMFLSYQKKMARCPELLGAGGHLVDVVMQ